MKNVRGFFVRIRGRELVGAVPDEAKIRDIFPREIADEFESRAFYSRRFAVVFDRELRDRDAFSLAGIILVVESARRFDRQFRIRNFPAAQNHRRVAAGRVDRRADFPAIFHAAFPRAAAFFPVAVVDFVLPRRERGKFELQNFSVRPLRDRGRDVAAHFPNLFRVPREFFRRHFERFPKTQIWVADALAEVDRSENYFTGFRVDDFDIFDAVPIVRPDFFEVESNRREIFHPADSDDKFAERDIFLPAKIVPISRDFFDRKFKIGREIAVIKFFFGDNFPADRVAAPKNRERDSGEQNQNSGEDESKVDLFFHNFKALKVNNIKNKTVS